MIVFLEVDEEGYLIR